MESTVINLCDPIFKTVVTCDTVSTEGYEVTNLLSEDCQKKRNGFLCDRFIKPPVEIILKFPFDVNIRYVKIGAEVGQQKTNGLEIYSSSVPYSSSLCSGFSTSNPQPKTSLVFSPMAERIASVFLNDGERGVVIFCPLQYGRQNLNPVSNINKDYVQKPMMWKKRSVIAHVSSLTVRIFRTYGSSVPGLGSIEVWGSLSSCMPSNKVADIMRLWKTAHAKKNANKVQDLSKDSPRPVPLKRPDLSLLTDVPEEFLDAITCEIMALPMVLPSGKVVDQQTLDLHAQAEANWGRHPSDPFTGIMFSDGCRPILDSALKARIDRFLVLNQDRKDLKTVPRTVGRAQPQICHQTVSRFRNNLVCFDSNASTSDRKRPALDSNVVRETLALSQPSRVPNNIRLQSMSRNNISLPSCSKSENTAESASKNAFLSKESKRQKLIQSKSSFRKDYVPSQYDSDNVCLQVDQSKSTSGNLKSHEEKMDDSLDSALKAALSGLPSFVNPPSPVELKVCGSCTISECLYKLPCSHFLCRGCLVKECKQNPSKCHHCLVLFKSSDPVLHHELS